MCGGQSDPGTSFSLQVLRFSPVSTIPPVLHTRLFINHRRYVILAVGSVIQQHT